MLSALVVLVAFLVSLKACPPWIYFGADIRGRVVDAETGQPLEGVVVVAMWCMTTFGGIVYGPHIKLYSADTVTDKVGNFDIPAWGPRLRPPWAWVDGNDPFLRFFKSGYVPQGVSNLRRAGFMVSHSDWNGKVIKLARSYAVPKDRLAELDGTLPMCGYDLGTFGKLADEILKERNLDAPGARPFFENVERLKRRDP